MNKFKLFDSKENVQSFIWQKNYKLELRVHRKIVKMRTKTSKLLKNIFHFLWL